MFFINFLLIGIQLLYQRKDDKEVKSLRFISETLKNEKIGFGPVSKDFRVDTVNERNTI